MALVVVQPLEERNSVVESRLSVCSISSERRIVCPEVARSLKAKMRPGGALWLATDVDDYPDHARRVLAAEGWAEAPCAEVLASARCPPWRRPSTKYERDGIAAGRDVCDVCFRCED